MQNCPHFGIKIPLVDTTEANGSFEVVPGSQYLNEFPAEAGMRWDDGLNGEGRAVDAAFGQTRRLNLKKGSMWVQDPRALHRGTPNTSDAARPELVICCKMMILSRFVALSVSLTPKSPPSDAAQLPWIQNTTVEGNILFGLPMERQVYEQTLAT